MPKDSLQGPLPSDKQTQEYLCEELGLPPGTAISLDLNDQLRDVGPPCARGVPWTVSVRIACLLAIWGSERRALTSEGILEALIAAIPFCRQHRELATKKPGEKRKGWAVSATLAGYYHETNASQGYRSQYPFEVYDLCAEDARGSAL